MADIRFKDLTTTASSTASDDFIAVDGTTNGTRKLNAYSPSFGGNATVAGTLAVNGGDVSASRFAVAAPSNTIIGNFTAGSTSNQSFGLRVYAGTSATDYALKIRNVADTLTLLNVDGVGTVSIGATTASTSTSTGALVVSGGLGVSGAMYIGGLIECSSGSGIRIRTALGTPAAFSLIQTGVATWEVKSPASDSTLVFRANDTTTALTLTNAGNATVTGTLTAGDNVTIPNAKNFVVRNAAASSTAIRMYADSSDFGYIDCTANTELRLQVGAGTKLSITNTGNVSIPATTASTSTSSGALVVSGGVGVAKSIVVGEEILVDRTTSDQTLLRLYATGGTGTFINFAETSIGGQSTGVAFLRWTRGGNQDRALSVHVSNSAGTSIKATTVDASGNLIQALNGTAPSLTTNSTMTFELTSNTSLKIFVRGSDGTTRSTTLTLA